MLESGIVLPDFLAIGPVAKDLTPEGFTLGGAVTYGSLTAQRLGLKPAVVTSTGSDVDPSSAVPGVPLHVIPSPDTTTFENSYDGGRRTQYIRGIGGRITPADIPEDWLAAPLVMLGPLAGEVDCQLARAFPNSIVIASMQGWLRQWDGDGRVSPVQWRGDGVLPYVDAAILSIDDIDDHALLDGWKDMTSVLIFTRGADGADLHFDGNWHHVEAFPVLEVDPTGAGDVFAAAYLLRFKETGDPLRSARFASCAASFCVAAPGVEGIPSRAQIEARLAGNSGQLS